MYYVYILKSLKDGRLYKGVTKDIDQRIKEHNTGKTKSTRPYKPWEVVYFESFDNFESARQRELYLKSGSGREFLKRI
ncbi:MAG: GIY-YIG nuclease family protein, partial [Bacteroidales bacterium]|nr:GIY-YIG nuclease family protein [Bacteroidales bacterium]